jgi:hypothetical protein
MLTGAGQLNNQFGLKRARFSGDGVMTPRSKKRVFREILSRPKRGLVTLDEAAGQAVYAIDDPSEADELLQLASQEMREAIQRFVQHAPQTDAEWDVKPFLVLDGDEQDVRCYRSRVRSAVEALRNQLG